MRAAIADSTTKMKRWTLRVALDDEAALAARGAPFALLKELLTGPRTTLLMVFAHGNHHFNALEQLARLCAQQRVWSSVLKPSAHRVKQLVVYVPRFASADQATEEIQRLALSIRLSVNVNVAACESVPPFVVDALVCSMVMHELELAG